MPRRRTPRINLACTAEQIRGALSTLRDPGAELVQRLQTWTELLQQWSSAQRLVGWRDGEDLLAEGLLDAWAAVPLLAESDPQPLLDLGSGSGLPAIVLAAAFPDRELHLVEARRKRASFLAASVRALSLEHVVVHNRRVEDLAAGGKLPQGAALSARAYAPPAQLLEQAERLDANRVLLSIGVDDLQEAWSGPWVEVDRCPGSPAGRRLHLLLKR